MLDTPNEKITPTSYKRILIMHPCRVFYEPYWLPETLCLQSMVTVDKEAKAYRGYLLVAL